MRVPYRTATLWLVAAATYYGTAWIGLKMAVFPETASPIWPAAGVAIAALTLLGLRAWPAIAVAVFLIELPAFGPLNSLLLTIGNTGEAVVGAYVLRSIGGSQAFLQGRTVAYFLVGVAGAAVISAGMAVYPLLSLGGGTPPAQLFGTWYLGDVMGGILVAPAILLLVRRHGEVKQRWPELIGFVVATILLGIMAFYPWSPALTGLRLGFIAVIPVAWAASRFGPPATAVTALALSLGAMLGLSIGGLPASSDANALLLQMQALVGMIGLLGLYLSATVHERNTTIGLLGDSAAMKKRFLNKASHELSTPITPALIHSATLKSAVAGSAAESAATALKKNLDRMSHVIHRLIDAAKIDDVASNLEIRAEDIGSFAADIESRIPKGCDVQFNVQGETSYMDRFAMRRVLDEFLANACQYAANHVRVTMKEEANHGLRITVDDDGPGIPEDQLHHLFEPMIETASTGITEGTGFGLYLAHTLVNGHGGTITAQASPLGGARMVIELPGRAKQGTWLNLR